MSGWVIFREYPCLCLCSSVCIVFVRAVVVFSSAFSVLSLLHKLIYQEVPMFVDCGYICIPLIFYTCTPPLQIHNFLIEWMSFLHLSRKVLKIELRGTDLFQNVTNSNIPWFPLEFSYFSSIFLIFVYKKSMILSLEWAQHIIRGTCWFLELLCTFYIFLWEPIVRDHSSSK